MIYSKSSIQEILSLYNLEKKSIQEISDYTGLNILDIKKCLSKFIKKIKVESYYVLHSYCKDFFEKINSEEKAYWLGFLYADGCVRYRNNKTSAECYLGICEKDLSHLEKFKNSINYSGDIKVRRAKTKFNNSNTVCISVCSKKFVQDLINKGCVPAKSLIIKFPDKEQVPENLIKHFIRGYFDGDGSVSCSFYGRENKKRTTIRFTSGSSEILNSIEEVFFNICKKRKALYSDKRKPNCFYLNYSSCSSLKLLYHYLYDNANVFLERKERIFKEVLNY